MKLMTHQGKIGILPQAIREELNLRLLDGQSGRKILPWLNSLPEVKRLLAENAEGLNVTDSNLSSWRQKGYAAWLRRREHIASLKEMSTFACQLSKSAGGTLTEGAAAILSGRIMEVLEGVQELSTTSTESTTSTPSTDPHSDKNESPEQKATRVAALAQSIKDLTDALATLRVGDQNNRRLAQNDKRLALDAKKVDIAGRELVMSEEEHQVKFCEGYLAQRANADAAAIAESSAPTPEKIQRLRKVFFADVDAAPPLDLPRP